MDEQKQDNQLEPKYKGCSLEDLSEAMDDREGLGERVREICADGAI